MYPEHIKTPEEYKEFIQFEWQTLNKFKHLYLIATPWIITSAMIAILLYTLTK